QKVPLSWQESAVMSASKFKNADGDWVELRNRLTNLLEVDFHYGSGRETDVPYRERMEKVWAEALQALRKAQAAGNDWVLFRHGASTSRLGATTSRSEVRGLMRSPEATPYIIRSDCIQHETVFVARIRKMAPAGPQLIQH
ncbi:MAG: hypothetical protein WCA14_13960, partial [Steroidobacteraceae bacterium]